MIRTKSTIMTHVLYRILLVSLLVLAGGCGPSDLAQLTRVFSLNVEFDQNAQMLVEGDAMGITLPVSVTRAEGYRGTLALTVSGAESRDDTNIRTTLSNQSLTPGADNAVINLKLDIGNVPIKAGLRYFIVTASDGDNVQQMALEISVRPVNAPDVYLLIGQSNMVGFGGDGEKDATPGGLDAPDDRIRQLNVTKNNEEEIFTTNASYTQTAKIALQPYIVRAEDPLHIPLNPETMAKAEDYIGLGLSFAKSALAGTDREIVLVPAAWSASAFCNASTLRANWNAKSTTNLLLGNTLLFDRAVARTNLALAESGGILRGILWHQGENDADQAFPDCATLYSENLVSLVEGLRSDIQTDARGGTARGPQADIPFTLGTMSRGNDENGDFSDFFEEKTIVDAVHRSVATLLPHASFTNLDDLTPANGFPCGNDSCIHFGSAAYREIGRRYYSTLLGAAGN